MKKIAFFLFLSAIYSLTIIAQENESFTIPKNEKGLAEYSEVIPIDSTSKSEIFVSVLEWYNKTYKSGKNVIQASDKEGGMIIGNAVTKTIIYNNLGIKKDGGYFSYTISVYCKDNKYKYVIDNITYNSGEMVLNPGADLAEVFPSNWTGLIQNIKYNRKQWISFQKQADTELRFVIDDLKSHLKNLKEQSKW
jgi:hypothetical protein